MRCLPSSPGVTSILVNSRNPSRATIYVIMYVRLAFPKNNGGGNRTKRQNERKVSLDFFFSNIVQFEIAINRTAPHPLRAFSKLPTAVVARTHSAVQGPGGDEGLTSETWNARSPRSWLRYEK